MLIVYVLLFVVAVNSTKIPEEPVSDVGRQELAVSQLKAESIEPRSNVWSNQKRQTKKHKYPSVTSSSLSEESSSREYPKSKLNLNVENKYVKGFAQNYPQYNKNYDPQNGQTLSISKLQSASSSYPQNYHRNAPPAVAAQNPVSYVTAAPAFSNTAPALSGFNYLPQQNTSPFNAKKYLAGLSSLNNFGYAPYSGLSHNPIIENPIANSNVHVPVYKATNLGSKFANPLTYGSGYQGGTSNFSPSYLSPKNLQNSETQMVDINGKKVALPVIQLQSSSATNSFPGYLHSFENQPLLLKSNLAYQDEPNFDFSFEFPSKSNAQIQSSGTSPLLSSLTDFQQQVVPIQTSTGNQQFPQYKGARVGAFPSNNNNFIKSPTNYTPLQFQPQLQFAPGPVINSQENYKNPPYFLPKSSEAIREDVEILKKKKPQPLPPPEEDEEDDENYKSSERESGEYSEEDDESKPPPKKYQDIFSNNNFKPSTSFPSRAYDEKFGRYSKPNQGSEADFSESAEDDNDDEQPSKYSSSESKPQYEKYEDDDEEETQHHEQEEQSFDPDYELQPKQYRHYGKDLEKEYEESYRQELPKEEFAHVKEVPEIDEPLLNSKRNYRHDRPSKSKNSRNNRRDRYRANRDEDDERRSERGQNYSGNRKPSEDNYEDSRGYNSNVSVKKFPKIIHQESFGYKKPRSTNNSQSNKKNSPKSEMRNEKRLRKLNSQVQEAISSSTILSQHSSSPEMNEKRAKSLMTELNKENIESDFIQYPRSNSKIVSLADEAALRHFAGSSF